MDARTGCDDRTEGTKYEITKIIYTSDFTLGAIPDGTKVEVYPTYLVIRRPAPDAATLIPMTQIMAIDVR
jgi:hypothetical protein